jgi:branched-chain amino acid transport system permease protein
MTSTTAPVIRSQRFGLLARSLGGRITAYLILAAVAVWLIFKLIDNPSLFFSSALAGLNNGALYALVALGYTLVYGIIELINFAHGDLFMLGTLFSAWLITTTLHLHGGTPGGWFGFGLTLVGAMVFCGLINVVIEFFAYRRLRRAPKLAPLITAVGVSFILQFVGLKWNGSNPRSGWPSMLPTGGFSIGGVNVDYSLFVVLGVTAALLAVMNYVVTFTRTGKAMRATAQDQDAARLMGINVNRVISATFLIGGALAGAAAVMYQQTDHATRYNAGFQLGLFAFTAAVLGGIGNLTGAVLGGVLIGLVQGLNDGVGLGQEWGNTVIFTILILVMVFKPTGLLGQTVGEKV